MPFMPVGCLLLLRHHNHPVRYLFALPQMIFSYLQSFLLRFVPSLAIICCIYNTYKDGDILWFFYAKTVVKVQPASQGPPTTPLTNDNHLCRVF